MARSIFVRSSTTGRKYTDIEFLSNTTKTVGASGQDYTNPNDALSFFKDRYLALGNKISLSAETFTQSEILADSLQNSLTIEGDTRELAGVAYMQGTAFGVTVTNAGTSTHSLSNSGNDLFVFTTGTYPNFSSAGYGNGDKAIVVDNSKSISELTISSTSSNTITFTTTCPTVGGDGSAVILLPNRKFTGKFTVKDIDGTLTLQGLYITGEGSTLGYLSDWKYTRLRLKNCVFADLTGSGTEPLIKVYNGDLVVGRREYGIDGAFGRTNNNGLVEIVGQNSFLHTNGCIFFDGQNAIYAYDKSSVRMRYTRCTFQDRSECLYFKNTRSINAERVFIDKAGDYGVILTDAAGLSYFLNCTIKGTVTVPSYGVYAAENSKSHFQTPTVQNWDIGVFASDQAMTRVESATYSGNNTDTSPAVNTFSGTYGLIST